MTLYLNFRSQAVGGSVINPQVFSGDGDVSQPTLAMVAAEKLAANAAGKKILFGVHGFNVSRDEGIRALARLEPALALSSSELFIGILWPGDFWLPVVNYPFEGAHAMDSGRKLADFCNRKLSGAFSLSFLSHSLGVRVVLEAVKYLDRKAEDICLTAAAINRDCLTGGYAKAAANAGAVSLLASRSDLVLKLAFPIGDPIADVLQDDHTPFQPALGYNGPSPVGPAIAPWQIPDEADYDHGNYLPPSSPAVTAAQRRDKKWPRAAAFMARAFRGQTQTWPS
jgi:Alpha/beta hydrolase of unknown function (DUF900)